MGTVAGNLLQRTPLRLLPRHPGSAATSAPPGTGCPAIAGESRGLGVVGVSADCIATHPVGHAGGAEMAMDAKPRAARPQRRRPHRAAARSSTACPATRRTSETNLLPGELITARSWCRPAARPGARATSRCGTARASSSPWLSAAVALDRGRRHGAAGAHRPRCGVVAPRPWRLPQVEAALHGKPATDAQLPSRGRAGGRGGPRPPRTTPSRSS